jgi:hypothetical protein
MTRLLLILFLLIATAGCDISLDLGGPDISGRRYNTETPVANLPISLRQRNWLSPSGQGSCTHATIVSALRWQCRPHSADNWRATHSGGETPQSLGAQLDAEGIRYTETLNKTDVAFLEQATLTRRGCLVTVMGGRHAVFLAGLDDQFAYLIDNNAPDELQIVERQTFIAEWQNSFSWGLCLLYSPASPLPEPS